MAGGSFPSLDKTPCTLFELGEIPQNWACPVHTDTFSSESASSGQHNGSCMQV